MNDSARLLGHLNASFQSMFAERPLDPPDRARTARQERDHAAAVEAQTIVIAENPSDFSDLVVLPLLDGEDLLSDLALLAHPDFTGDLSAAARRIQSQLRRKLEAAAQLRTSEFQS